MKNMLQDMTFLEFRDRCRDDTVVILPFGSVEIQGPRAPMGDFRLATELAMRVAERTGAIVAPTVPFGVAEVFRGVPGGMQLRAATFRALVADLVGAFLDHGIDRLLLFNGHTGNHAPIAETAQMIRRERGVILPWLNIWPMVPSSVLQQAFGENASRASGHGAAVISSVYDALVPGITDQSGIIPPEHQKYLMGLPTAGLSSVRQGDVEVFVPMNMLDHCDAVVSGDATLSNAAAGQIVADYIIDKAVALVEHLKTAPVRDGAAQKAAS